MRRLTMTNSEVRDMFHVGRWWLDKHRGELGAVKCGSRVVYPVARVAEYFGVDRADVHAAMEEEVTR